MIVPSPTALLLTMLFDWVCVGQMERWLAGMPLKQNTAVGLFAKPTAVFLSQRTVYSQPYPHPPPPGARFISSFTFGVKNRLLIFKSGRAA